MTEEQIALLVPALRVARKNMRAVADEIDCLGIMLTNGGITMDEALDWLDELGITGYVGELSMRMMKSESVGPVIKLPVPEESDVQPV